MNNPHDLDLTALFVAVVQSGSFTGAARRLNIPKSTLSQKISTLELHLKTQLLRRTTRRLDLTEAGELFFSRAEPLVASLQELDRQVMSLSSEPTGGVRITLPPSLLDLIAPVLAQYLSRFPDVSIESHDLPNVIDLESRGFDLAVRACHEPPKGLYSQLLFEGRQLLVAQSGQDLRVGFEALADLPALGLIGTSEWQLEAGSVQPRFRYRCDNTRSLVSAVEAGLGVALLGPLACAKQMRRGQIQPLRDEQGRNWVGPAVRLWALCPSRRWLTAAGRRLLEALSDFFSQLPPFF